MFISHLCSPSLCSSKGKTTLVSWPFGSIAQSQKCRRLMQERIAFCSLTLVIRSGPYTSNYTPTQATEPPQVEMRVRLCIILNTAVHPAIPMSCTAVWSAQIIYSCFVITCGFMELLQQGYVPYLWITPTWRSINNQGVHSLTHEMPYVQVYSLHICTPKKHIKRLQRHVEEMHESEAWTFVFGQVFSYFWLGRVLLIDHLLSG